MRFLQGVTNGIAHPCASALWSRWAPPEERGRLASFSLSGVYIGIIVVQPITGLVTRYYSWETSFYVVGIGALFWLPAWISYSSDTPSNNRFISQNELAYLQRRRRFSVGITSLRHSRFIFFSSGVLSPIIYLAPRGIVKMSTPSEKRCRRSTGKEITKKSTPWLNILFSIPIWGNLFAFFAHDFLTYTFLTSLPKYLNNVHNFDVSKSGIVSSLTPFFEMDMYLEKNTV